MPSSRRPSPGRPQIFLALLVALIAPALLGSARPAAAQSPPLRIEAWLHMPYVVIQSESNARPTVTLYDAEGERLSEVTPSGAKNGGGWRVNLDAIDRRGYRVLLRPGHRIVARIGLASASLTVPELPATIDPDADRISGRVAIGKASVGLQLRRDANWFDAPNSFAARQTTAAEDGSFDFDLAGEQDLQPGWSADVYTQLPGGHYVIQGLAVPAITFSATGPAAYVRANAGSEVVLGLRNRIGTEVFRSGPGTPIGSALYQIPLYQAGNPDFGAYAAREDETVAVEIDGVLRIEDALPRALASIDRFGGSVWGLTEPGARVRLAVTGDDRGLTSLVADAEGHFEHAVTARGLGPESTADVVLLPGGPVARLARAEVPFQQILLYDNFVQGRLPGWGRVTGELWRGDRLIATDAQEIAVGETFYADFRLSDGSEPAIEPGDQLRFRPELGRPLELAVPALSVDVSEDRQSLSGQALPDRQIDARAFYAGISILDLQPLARNDSSVLLSASSDAEGRYRIDCDGPPCQMNYGILAASRGDDRYYLYWLRQAYAGLGVTARVAALRGTAGTRVDLRAFDSAGTPAAAGQGVIAPRAVELPNWEQDLSASFPEGLAPGSRVEIETEAKRYVLEVPEMRFAADVRLNRVTGSGPPGEQIAAVAYARGENAANRGARSVTGQIGADGRWSLQLPNFDLRSGDDVEIYILQGDRYLWWNLDAVEGLDPPRPTARPSAIPSATPRPSATFEPSPTPRPGTRRLFLPRLERP